MPYTVATSFDALSESLALSDAQRTIVRGRLAHLRIAFKVSPWSIRQEPFWIGSYGRDTLIRWERDVDALVAMSDAHWPSFKADSRAFLYAVRDTLNAAYTGSKVSSREVAVRLNLTDEFPVDLVPAFVHDKGGFIIPDGSRGWLRTNPLAHDKLVSDRNARFGSEFKPLVRVMKAWNSANGHRLRSFHLEMMVQHIWRHRTVLPPLPRAVNETFTSLDPVLAARFVDPWPFSLQFLDSYLSDDDRAKIRRVAASDALTSATALLLDASGNRQGAIAEWAKVFPARFPAYG